MKKLFFFFLIITQSFTFNLSKDKKEHILETAFISALSDEIYTKYYEKKYLSKPNKTQRYIISISSGILAGIIKELYDKSKSNNHFDNDDLKADILGSVLGSILKIEIKWK